MSAVEGQMVRRALSRGAGLSLRTTVLQELKSHQSLAGQQGRVKGNELSTQ